MAAAQEESQRIRHGLNKPDPRAKLIDPALHACGWTEDLIRREETAATAE